MGDKRKRREVETFADAGEPARSRSKLVSSPIRDGEYLDPDGVRWRKSDFVAAEFKDDQQRSMLIVEESC